MTSLESLPIEGTSLRWVDRLPDSLPDATRLGPHIQVRPGDVLFELPGVGRFRACEGSHIDVEVAPEATRELAAFYAHVTPYGALVHQRGELPFHASTVMRPDDGKVFLLTGNSGAGKSTTAAAFVKRGWKVLNDDVSRLTLLNNTPVVWPGMNQIKLWGRSCNLLDLDTANLERTAQAGEHFFFRQPRSHGGPYPISAIVELRHDDALKRCAITRERGTNVIRVLMVNTFRPRLVVPLGQQRSHFTLVQGIAVAVPCYSASNSHALPPHELAVRLEKLL